MTPLLPPFDLPEDIVLLIVDELAAPADFILHKALAEHLKSPARRGDSPETKLSPNKVVILSASESFQRWKALASKSNLQLQNYINNGSVSFIPVGSDICDDDSGRKLRDVFSVISEKITTANTYSRLLIFDDISSLEWMGIPNIQLQQFLRAVRAMCLKHRVTLLIRHHLLSPDESEPDELFRFLLQICTHHLAVHPLASGRSGAVTGEISLHKGFSAPDHDNVRLIHRSSAIQYNLVDSGPDFFAKGTSGGVL
ncbi:hypothetical protein CPB83DRAFT_767582 [Crepidotus variabilis]|uniref:Elongator complex protein 5 n=1 Tax=Crepidotus variabilis TaxID=179855 RepID=A0A9P6EF41_9AGAR|nr:hypothetical protein CPB83DRAFT_767582 [Crepidotus variabilis]